jgi:hypothetical protein
MDQQQMCYSFPPTSSLSWTFLMAHSKAKLKNNGDKTSHFRLFSIENPSHRLLFMQTLLKVSFKYILISLTSFIDGENSVRILNNTSLLTEL